jgi:hypothetical protein
MALRRLPVIDSSVADGEAAARDVAVANSVEIPADSSPATAQGAVPATESSIGSSRAAIGSEAENARAAGASAGDRADKPGLLGVLSVHFEGGRCRVACPFCYLGERAGVSDHTLLDSEGLVREALHRLPYRELAIALSEPIEPVLPLLERLVRTASDRGKLVAITTTLAVAQELPAPVLRGTGRLNLSIDPWKATGDGRVSGRAASGQQVTAAEVQAVLRRIPEVPDRSRPERVLIVTLSTQRFAEQVRDGLLAELLALPEVDRVALNALKPPPPWCDRAFWMRTLSSLRPLLREHLDRRLFLDCYVAARLLGIGGCPARPDLSPAPASASASASGAIAFRGCVYQREPDFVTASADELVARLRGFTPPERCPFPIV